MPAWEATTSPPSAEEARCGASPPRVARHPKMRFAFAIPRKEKANPPLAPSEVEHVAQPPGTLFFGELSFVSPLLRRAQRPTRFPNLPYWVMKHVQQIRSSPSSNMRRLQVEESSPSPPAARSWLPRLILGGAICGGFAGSFAGALLGMAVGIVYHDISLGLDGALLGGIFAAGGGAAYGLILALREKSPGSSSGDEIPCS
jgi:hypothetical protein